ncbi:hypothetical protein Plhal304r1_c024g0082071 [Plasmopara halstedii]
MVAVNLETKLVKACEEGNVDVCQRCLVDLGRQYEVAAEDVQELIGYAFSCAAGHNQIVIMELLLCPVMTLDSDGMTFSRDFNKILLYGICRWEKYFPQRPRFQCCFALRYLAYAAVLCVEQNALQALELLIQPQFTPVSPLLVNTDVLRCFCYALELGSEIHAPAPETYRPVLMLLLYRFSELLLAHVDGTHDLDKSIDGTLRGHMEALRSSLLYEYVTNPRMHKQE